MSYLSRRFALLVGAMLIVAACTGTPVYNVESQPLAVSGNPSLGAVERAIRRAAANRGWTVKKLGPGRMEGRLALRRHVALIDITYTRSTLSITYKDSQNLNYDGKTIHKNYNSWVQNLAKDINAQVSAL